jgi:hypothetical protein
MMRAKLKGGADFPLFSAPSDKFCAPSPSKNKAETIKQNGFSGTCLTCEHIQSTGKFEFQSVDDQHISDCQMLQHAPF